MMKGSGIIEMVETVKIANHLFSTLNPWNSARAFCAVKEWGHSVKEWAKLWNDVLNMLEIKWRLETRRIIGSAP